MMMIDLQYQAIQVYLFSNISSFSKLYLNYISKTDRLKDRTIISNVSNDTYIQPQGEEEYYYYY
ncbi:hypothetical protein PACTADRAFT_47765 [Pachysolen tannophilus NRRL Y-2460]|uniref:Uncharacterized protein n=1 Tax=Pachysolen tannophilus NRRL Y-2460 TaxID=669874 RepID=A0A1E4U1P8_PACTA|nr:hypothetical protein PACTADRAFT_47765 [Pachysolen tannophilus NRRL Y-2460]